MSLQPTTSRLFLVSVGRQRHVAEEEWLDVQCREHWAVFLQELHMQVEVAIKA